MKIRRYAVVMAGGRGTRFWPLSRLQTPKQLLKMWSGKSLIRETLDRVLPLFGPENTLVVTVADHYESIRKELSMLPKANFLVEPQGNNTAPCIGLAAIELASRHPNAIMTVLPADHWVSDIKSFRRTLQAATQLAERHDALVTIGIRPNSPETGYGYILRGTRMKEAGGMTVYRVRGFKEKPTLGKARQLMRRGSLWNSGIFSWRVSTILEMLGRFAPSISQGLDKIEKGARGLKIGSRSPRLQALIRREYGKMPNISIDHAVLEKAGAENRVVTVSARFDWSDVGSWASVHRMLPRDKNGNAGVGRWMGMQSKDCLVYTQDRLVAFLGIQDAVIIDTPDALLVCDIRQSQRVRDLVEELERKGYGRYTIG